MQSIKMFRGGKVHRAYSVFASVLLQLTLGCRLEEYAASPKEPDRRSGNWEPLYQSASMNIDEEKPIGADF